MTVWTRIGAYLRARVVECRQQPERGEAHMVALLIGLVMTAVLLGGAYMVLKPEIDATIQYVITQLTALRQ